MKKLTFISILFFLISFGFAQQVDKASKPILDAISKKTKAYTTIKIEFDYVLEGKDKKQVSKQSGKIDLKGQKFKLNLTKQMVICDGATTWTYMSETNEVQINDYAKKNDAITPSNILTIWEKDFKSKLIDEQTVNGVVIQTIDLVPTVTRQYYKVRLFIDKAKQQLTQAQVFQKDGQTHKYIIKKFTPNEVIADTEFTFNKKDFPKAEVIDLR